MALSKSEREIRGKAARRILEKEMLRKYYVSAGSQDLPIHRFVVPKKPEEFKFDKDKVESFSFPIDIGNTVVEKKSDGYCTIVSIDHKAAQKIKLYSSGGNEWNTQCFPELERGLLHLPSGIYHGEVLGTKPKHLTVFNSLDEYNAIKSRPKLSINDVTPKILEMYPLRLDLFDVLRLESKSMLVKPLVERRRALENVIGSDDHVGAIFQWNVNTKLELYQRFNSAIQNGYEGLIAKDPESLYVPASRNCDWIKLKEFLTLDLAILGLYDTQESLAARKPFSAILVGSYNATTNKFETIAKVKVGGQKDQDTILSSLERISEMIPYNNRGLHLYFNPAIDKIDRKIPDRLIEYHSKSNLVIAEIQAQDVTYSDNWHSCGLGYDGKHAHSLRIASFKQVRSDKTELKDITTTEQIHEYFVG